MENFDNWLTLFVVIVLLFTLNHVRRHRRNKHSDFTQSSMLSHFESHLSQMDSQSVLRLTSCHFETPKSYVFLKDNAVHTTKHGIKAIMLWPDKHGVSVLILSTGDSSHKDILTLLPKDRLTADITDVMLAYTWDDSDPSRPYADGLSISTDVEERSKKHFAWFLEKCNQMILNYIKTGEGS